MCGKETIRLSLLLILEVFPVTPKSTQSVGSDPDALDIYITRFSITVARKAGTFEQKHLVNKYRPLMLQRMEADKIGQFVKEQIVLPCAVQTGKKSAFYHQGTVYITLERLPESMGTLQYNEWQKEPDF